MTDAPQPPRGVAAFFPALRHRNFRLFYEGQLVSLIGSWMQVTALGYVVYRLEGSHEKLGWIAFASQIPNLLAAPFAGVFADRHSRLRIVVATQILAMLQAIALTVVVATGQGSFPVFFALSLVLGLINSFDMPTRQSLAIELSSREDLPNAIALNSIAFNVARSLGPLAAGFLLVRVSPERIFLTNALSFLFVLLALARIRVPPRPPVAREGDVLHNLVEGFRFAFRHACLRDVLLNVGVVSFVALPYQALMAGIVEEAFGGGAKELGYALSAIGVGALFGAGAATAGFMADRPARRIAVCGLAFGLALTSLSLCRSFPLALGILLPMGAAMMLLTISSNTLLQTVVPDRMRGRVMSFYTMMLLGLIPFGSILAGRIGDAWGIQTAMRGGGTICAIAALVFSLRLRAIDASVARLREAEGEKDAKGG